MGVHSAGVMAALDSGDYKPLSEDAYEYEALVAHFKYCLIEVQDEQEQEFVLALLKGMSYHNAAKAAGYTTKQARHAYRTLPAKPAIQRAVRAGRAAKAFANNPTRAGLLKLRHAIATANILDFWQFDSDGTPEFIGHKASREQWSAVKRFKVTRRLEGRGQDKTEVEEIYLELYDGQKERRELGADLGFWTGEPSEAPDGLTNGRKASNDRRFAIMPVPSGRFVPGPQIDADIAHAPADLHNPA